MHRVMLTQKFGCKQSPAKPPGGFWYWSFIMVYTDDILVVNHEPNLVLEYLAGLVLHVEAGEFEIAQHIPLSSSKQVLC